jgi:threonine aldolase
MIRGHPNGNQDLEVDDTIFVEFIQQYDEKIKHEQKHAADKNRRFRLGAPVGSVLCGSEEQVRRARRWRKVLGGGMRQAGILAAAGIFALSHNVQRLEQDHENALTLARGLARIDDRIQVDVETVQTNILYADIRADMDDLCAFLRQKGGIIDRSSHLRLVTHLDISSQDIEDAIAAFTEFFA